jgi:hypothetical protein
MNKTRSVFAGISICGLAAAAYAEGPIPLSDWQMDTITAGGAKAVAAFQTSAIGRNTAINTSLGNITFESSYGSFAQTRTGVLATASGNASVNTSATNQSAAAGQVATASTAGSASGDTATVHSVDVTTATSASGLSGSNSIGVTDSLARITTFSASGNRINRQR